MQKVINAIHRCSCGKFEKQQSSFNKKGKRVATINDFLGGVDCKCTGSKSWTQLFNITKLHPNTLSNTCKYLVKKKVLNRTRLRKHGKHVLYSIKETYWNDTKLRLEIELSKKEIIQLERLAKKDFRTLRIIFDEKLSEYKKQLNRLKTVLPEATELPVFQGIYILKMIQRHGLDEGIRLFIDQYYKFGASVFDEHVKSNFIGKVKLERLKKQVRPLTKDILRL